jgi:hypothetical protein
MTSNNTALLFVVGVGAAPAAGIVGLDLVLIPRIHVGTTTTMMMMMLGSIIVVVVTRRHRHS